MPTFPIFHHSGGGSGKPVGGSTGGGDDDGGGSRIKKGHVLPVPPWQPFVGMPSLGM